MKIVLYKAGLMQAVLFVVGFIFLSCVWGMGTRVPVEGTPAADFHLKDLAGSDHQLSRYRGKIVLLNFWATWCKPCTKEMPAMQASYDRFKDQGLVVLAINELEDVDRVRSHIREHQHTFPVLLDQNNAVANLYGVYGLPVSVFIDHNGTVQEYIKGGLLTEEKIERVFHKLTQTATIRADSKTS